MKFEETYKNIIDDLQPSSELMDRLKVRQVKNIMSFMK